MRMGDEAMSNPSQIRVLLVDDSAVVRDVLQRLLNNHLDIRVIATAPNPLIARDRMAKEWPDVVVLDVEMPKMDGITFLRQIMKERPTPIVLCTANSERGVTTTLEAMQAGAVAVVANSNTNVRATLPQCEQDLVKAIRSAVGTKPRPMATPKVPKKWTADAVLAPKSQPVRRAVGGERIVAVGLSTGGTQALEDVLLKIPEPEKSYGTVVVQHMPANFTQAFAQRLDKLCQVAVKEAERGDRVVPGRVLIAPGGKHMVLKRSGLSYAVDVLDGPPVNRHRPSVDVLFRSVAQVAGSSAIGIIMTGMGDDGARGLKEMHEAGALTFAQDEASCVVYGMPREAVLAQAVDEEVSLDKIPSLFTPAALQMVHRTRSKAGAGG